jgi:hypothetical protein
MNKVKNNTGRIEKVLFRRSLLLWNLQFHYIVQRASRCTQFCVNLIRVNILFLKVNLGIVFRCSQVSIWSVTLKVSCYNFAVVSYLPPSTCPDNDNKILIVIFWRVWILKLFIMQFPPLFLCQALKFTLSDEVEISFSNRRGSNYLWSMVCCFMSKGMCLRLNIMLCCLEL